MSWRDRLRPMTWTRINATPSHHVELEPCLPTTKSGRRHVGGLLTSAGPRTAPHPVGRSWTSHPPDQSQFPKFEDLPHRLVAEAGSITPALAQTLFVNPKNGKIGDIIAYSGF